MKEDGEDSEPESCGLGEEGGADGELATWHTSEKKICPFTCDLGIGICSRGEGEVAAKVVLVGGNGTMRPMATS